MTDVEREESKKTVVAFITGLLIGGLLVWVFASSPEATPTTEETKDTTTEVSTEKTGTVTTTSTEVAKTETGVTGTGKVTVADQKAGKTVTLGATAYPSENGWIVVRDYMDGVPGNILGAARYSTGEKLLPTQVELVRDTVAGSSYQVSFYSNDTDVQKFTVGEDKPVGGGEATFKAN